MPAVTSALVALGSNLPARGEPPAGIVTAALGALGALGAVRARSRLWRSPAWPPGGPPYVNAAAWVDTALAPEDALAMLHDIEAAWGRERRQRWGARTLDLDLLAMGDLVRPDAATQGAWAALPLGAQGQRAPAGLILPHPRLQDRGFVLRPLAEVAPGWRHPLRDLSVREMLAVLPPAALEGIEPLEPG